MIDFTGENLSFCGGDELSRRFALRDFDENRILQRKFFADFNFAADEDDVTILSSFVGSNELKFASVEELIAYAAIRFNPKLTANIVDAAELEQKSERLADLHISLLAYQKIIERHGDRLTRYMNAVANFVVANENSAETEKIRRRYQIATALRNRFYLHVAGCVKHFAENVGYLHGEIDRSAKHSYRQKFAARLKSARREKKWTQKTLAKKIGLSQNGYVYYEQAEREPTVALIARCVKIFGCSAGWLLGIDD